MYFTREILDYVCASLLVPNHPFDSGTTTLHTSYPALGYLNTLTLSLPFSTYVYYNTLLANHILNCVRYVGSSHTTYFHCSNPDPLGQWTGYEECVYVSKCYSRWPTVFDSPCFVFVGGSTHQFVLPNTPRAQITNCLPNCSITATLYSPLRVFCFAVLSLIYCPAQKLLYLSNVRTDHDYFCHSVVKRSTFSLHI